MIRDPREVIISACHYHKRTSELWCNSSDFENLTTRGSPIPSNKFHYSLEWKQEFIARLNGSSYRENINALPIVEAIKFEMNNYTSWTITDMLQWDYQNPLILELKMEELSQNFDLVFKQVFMHLQFSSAQQKRYLKIAAIHDIQRTSSATISENDHIRSTKSRTWNTYFTPEHMDLFNELFGSDCCTKLGY